MVDPLVLGVSWLSCRIFFLSFIDFFFSLWELWEALLVLLLADVLWLQPSQTVLTLSLSEHVDTVVKSTLDTVRGH